ncbi:interactor of constitutive active ROPs 3-like isoform X3 [Phalaenopsis equestris]|uniref:interactor of constitutive active ROPs 3-like isoform X3 n=2 Tax=Phalaenopsis equestris TaxID=78828 RepID=UPI0009E5F1F9|nr:interactor of constitutive active ROPs 3-like isoform X3 [Phalaenopsis equestris]
MQVLLLGHRHSEEMQANKSSRAAKPSHRISSATTRPQSLSKAIGADANSTEGINHQSRKFSSYRSQKENEQKSDYYNSVFQKSLPSQFTDLESRLGELQEELKRTKDQLSLSESSRKRAQQEAEEAKKQILIFSSKLEESQHQLIELSAAEDDRIQELRKLSQQRDKAWQSELAALQNQQSIDMAAWSSAIKERQKLKSEIEMFVKSEAAMAEQLESTNSELCAVKEDILEKNSAIERLKFQIAETKSAEVKATESLNEALLQLDMSKARVNELEAMVKKLQANQRFEQEEEKLKNNLLPPSASELMEKLETLSSEGESKLESELKEAKAEIANLKSELINKDEGLQNLQSIDMAAWNSAIKEGQKLKSEFEMFVKSEAAMAKQLDSTNSELQAVKDEILEKNSAIERLKIQIAERKSAEDKATKSFNEALLQLEMSKSRVNELEDKVKKLQANQNFEQKEEQLKNNVLPLSVNELLEKLETLSSEGESKLESELKEAKAEIANLESKLTHKDEDLRSISHMNKKLNDEIRARVNQVEAEFSSKITQAAVDISELKARLSDKEVEIQKLSDENNLIKMETGKKEMKEMEGIKSYEAEMEAELRRVKQHSDQWRKAAETAAAILMAESHGRIVERTGSVDPQSFYDGRNLMRSPILDEIGETSRSKNHNVLTMIGGFWKKS